MVLAAFLTALAYGIAYFPAFFVLARNLKVSTANLYIMLFIGYAISSVAAYLSGPWIDRFGRLRTVMLGSAILGLCVAAYALVQSWLGFLLAIIGVAVSFYVWRVAFKTALYDATIAKVRGEQIGFYKTCTGIGDMLGPLLGGILIDMVSLPAAFIAGAATSIAASAIMKTATR